MRWEDEQGDQARAAGGSLQEEAGVAGAAASSGAKAVGPRHDTGADQMQVSIGGRGQPRPPCLLHLLAGGLPTSSSGELAAILRDERPCPRAEARAGPAVGSLTGRTQALPHWHLRHPLRSERNTGQGCPASRGRGRGKEDGKVRRWRYGGDGVTGCIISAVQARPRHPRKEGVRCPAVSGWRSDSH